MAAPQNALHYDDGRTITVTAGRHTFCSTCNTVTTAPGTAVEAEATAATAHVRHTVSHAADDKPSRRRRRVGV